MRSAGGGPDFVSELFLPEAFNLVNNILSQSGVSKAQDVIRDKLGALSSLHDEVSRRETGERTWLDQQIDGDLGRQMDAAKLASAN
jgi:hypothetical protein